MPWAQVCAGPGQCPAFVTGASSSLRGACVLHQREGGPSAGPSGPLTAMPTVCVLSMLFTLSPGGRKINLLSRFKT